MGRLHTLNRTGDEELAWDPQNPISTTLAGAEFARLTTDGYVAFEVTTPGDVAVQAKTFHPEAHEIIFAKPLQGG